MNFKHLFYRLKKIFFPAHITSKEYVNFLQSQNISIGEGTHFFYPCSNTIDTQRPWLLSIGKYCKITEGVTIIAHDYSRSVLRMKFGDVVGEAKKTYIGDNVFIGMKSIILMGAEIGDNVIIGAGAVVSGKIPSNTVVAGVPARVICSLDEYYEKRRNKTLEEAVHCFQQFKQFYHREPSIKEMGAFFPLYLERNEESLKRSHVKTNLSGDNELDVISKFLNSSPLFDSYDSFKKYANSRLS